MFSTVKTSSAHMKISNQENEVEIGTWNLREWELNTKSFDIERSK